MLIAQISDCHVSTKGSPIDHYFRTASYLERAVRHINALSPAPDVVLLTGDLVDRGEVEEYERIRSILDPLRCPVYVIPGNHDARKNLASAFADKGYLPDGFLQYVVEDYAIRLIALDTHVPGEAGGLLCAERIAWLAARLAESTRPTVLFMHHPPFDTGIVAMDQMGLSGRQELEKVVARHPHVERVLCGHVHRPITRRFAGTIASICPSTAHQVELDLTGIPRLAVIMEPPMVQLHLWHGEESGLVTHHSMIGLERPAVTLYDGERWLKDAKIPPNFHGPT
jgi:Icc protein